MECEDSSTESACGVTPDSDRLVPSMAPRKPPANAEAEAKAQGNSTLFDDWRRSRAGRPKKSGNLASNKIVVKANDANEKKKKPGPVPKLKPTPRQKTTANEDGIHGPC
jgi:hypothetical protein